MIQSKKDYREFVNYEKNRYKNSYETINWEHRKILKYLKLYRKTEYYHNCHKDRIRTYFLDQILHYYSIKYGFHIPINIIDKGLVIIHIGPIYIHKDVKIGKDLKIHPMTTISASLGGKNYPIIGNGVWIGPGTRIYGNITIGNNVVIGTNSVVNKSFGDNITVAGNPAKKINDKQYKDYFNRNQSI